MAAWFETVADAQRRARKRLPPSVYSALVAGSEKGVTVSDNTAAFAELGFAPHVAGLSGKRDMATTVMGQAISLPVLISPTGVQAVHPDGEVAVARAAGPRHRDRPVVVREQAHRGGHARQPGHVLPDVLDRRSGQAAGPHGASAARRRRGPHHHHRLVVLERQGLGRPAIPERMDLKAMLRFAPEGSAGRGGYSSSLRRGGFRT